MLPIEPAELFQSRNLLALFLPLIGSLISLGSSEKPSPYKPIYSGNEAVFQSLQVTRYSSTKSFLHIFDAIELFLLGSTTNEIEHVLSSGSGQHRFAVDVSAAKGGFYVSSNAPALRLAPPPALASNDDNGDLMIFSRVRIQPPTLMSTLLTILSPVSTLINGKLINKFYRPLLSVAVSQDRMLVEYFSEQQSEIEPVRIPVPLRIVDDQWHSLVIHWTTSGNSDTDDLYLWLDCQLIHQGIAPQPAILSSTGSTNWIVSVGLPEFPAEVDQPRFFSAPKPFGGFVEQLVITRDRLFWQSDEQCKYQLETSAIKNICPMCTSATFYGRNAIKSAQTKLLSAIGRNKRKLSKEFDIIREQLDAAVERIRFLEGLQKHESTPNEATVEACFDKDQGRHYLVNETWSSGSCTRTCKCVLVNDKPRSDCSPLRCSPANVADCPQFPFGGVVWDLSDNCCPRCLRRSENSVGGSGRPCVRWHRTSSVRHGTLFLIRLENETCAEKRCIDGREVVVRQGPRSSFCGACLKNSAIVINDSSVIDRALSRRACCGVDDPVPCKVRSCFLNASTTCDSPERATCTDTTEDIICQCRPGYIGDGRQCIDIDECQEKIGTRFSANCSDGEVCINTAGGYHCVVNTPVPDSQLVTLSIDGREVNREGYDISLQAHSDIEGSPAVKCDEQSEIMVRYSPSTVMCHCLPGFARLRPTVLLAFVRENWPGTLSFARNYSTNTAPLPNAQHRCFDIDECLHVNSACSLNLQCANIPGSYICISTAYDSQVQNGITPKLTANARRSAENSFGARLSPNRLTILLFLTSLAIVR